MDTYEKKYKEALERARALRNEAIEKEYVDDYIKDYETIFPELRESDDERIRKWIIEELEITRDAMSGKHPYSDDPDIVARLKRLDEAIDYLEKQKDFAANEYWRGFGAGRDEVIANPDAFNLQEKQQEIPMPNSTTLLKMWDDEEKMLREKGIDDMWRLAYNAFLDGFAQGMMVKQKEQKSAEKQDYSGLTDLERAIHRGFLVAGVENVPVKIIKETAQECLAQMKPAEWSEEDKNKIDVIIRLVEQNSGWPDRAIKEYVNWLKSLRPQPKVELSEDVKKTLDEVSHILVGLNYKQIAKDYKQAVEKLLYSRSSWKPSEEHMRILNWAANGMMDTCIAAPEMRAVLRDLYEQLKKL